MKFTLKLAVEIRKHGRPEPCDRPHADEPPEQLPGCTEAVLDLARGWDHDQRSPAVAARFGFTRPPATPVRPGEERPDGSVR